MARRRGGKRAERRLQDGQEHRLERDRGRVAPRRRSGAARRQLGSLRGGSGALPGDPSLTWRTSRGFRLSIGPEVPRQARRVEQQAERTFLDNPLAVGAAVLAVGAVVGLSLPRSRREDQLMGETRDRLLQGAQGAAHDAAIAVRHLGEEAASAINGGLSSTRSTASRFDLREQVKRRPRVFSRAASSCSRLGMKTPPKTQLGRRPRSDPRRGIAPCGNDVRFDGLCSRFWRQNDGFRRAPTGLSIARAPSEVTMVQSSRASIVGWAVVLVCIATVVSGCWVHDGRGRATIATKSATKNTGKSAITTTM